MSEKTMRAEVIKLLAPLDAVPIENILGGETGPGTPDVNFKGGWAELKYLRDWPARASTIVRLDHYTDHQRAWLLRRASAGEPTFLILQAARREWFVWDSVNAQSVGHLTREALGKTALAHWTGKPTSDELIHILTDR